jgi:hypothetical protein
MTRKILIRGVKVEVSKNEAKEAERIAYMVVPGRLANEDAQWNFELWYRSAPTPEAKLRREIVGKALGLKLCGQP